MANTPAVIRANPAAVFRTPWGNFRGDPTAVGAAINEAAMADTERRMAAARDAQAQSIAQSQQDALTRQAELEQQRARDWSQLRESAKRAPQFQPADYSRPSLLTSDPKSLSVGDQQIRDYYLNMGLNPDNPGERLTTGTPGYDIGSARSINAITSGFFFKPGERRLSHGEADRALVGSIQNGSDGALDWNDPKWTEKFGQAIPQTIRPTRERNGRTEFTSPTMDDFRARYGYDPFDNPQQQAQSIAEHTGAMKSRENSLASTYRENMRTMGERAARGMLARPSPSVDLGGTIETGGRSFRAPAGGGPMFETTPVRRSAVPQFDVPTIEETMTPDAFANPNPAARGMRPVTPISQDGASSFDFSPERSAAVMDPATSQEAAPDFTGVSNWDLAGRVVNHALSGGWGSEQIPFGAAIGELWKRGTKRAIWNYPKTSSGGSKKFDLYAR